MTMHVNSLNAHGGTPITTAGIILALVTKQFKMTRSGEAGKIPL